MNRQRDSWNRSSGETNQQRGSGSRDSSDGGNYRGRGGFGPRNLPRRDDKPRKWYRTSDNIVPKPDAAVTKDEDDFMKQSQGVQNAGLLPQRPGHGSVGTKVVVYTNAFELKPRAELTFYRYSIEVKQEQNKDSKVSKGQTKQLVSILLENPDYRGVLTDFRSTLISLKKLENVPCVIIIPFRRQGEDNPPKEPKMYRLTIQESGTVLVWELFKHLKSLRGDEPPFVQRGDVIQALNMILGHQPQMRKDVVTIGQNNHFLTGGNAGSGWDLRDGSVALRGFFKSVRPATSRLLLNVNVSHAVCYRSGPLITVMNATSTTWDWSRMAKHLKHLLLETIHLPPKKNKAGEIIPRIVSFHDFATQNDGNGGDHPPRVDREYPAGPRGVEFFLAEKSGNDKGTPKAAGNALGGGRYITVWDYFRKNYPQINMDNNYPVINVGDRLNPRYLPMEACKVIAGQPLGKKLSPDATSLMLDFACREPHENATSIVNDSRAVLGLDAAKNAILSKNGISIGASLITVPARILPSPQINYLKVEAPNLPKTVIPMNGSWNLSNVKSIRGSQIKSWNCVVMKPDRRDIGKKGVYWTHDMAKETVPRFRNALIKFGVNISETSPREWLTYDMQARNSSGSEQMTKKTVEAFMKHFGEMRVKPNFLLIILPYIDTALYERIKTLADIKYGIHTICVLGEKFMTGSRQDQYFANVALKFNLKAGGVNHKLDAPKLGIVGEGKTMVVGIDVTHPSPGSSPDAPSVAGIVASINQDLGQWPAQLSIQSGRKEMVTSLREMLKSRLLLWAKNNNKSLPENILIYRDGVSEGQYQTVLTEELPLLRDACKEVYPANKKPAMSIIIVGKRHNTRFYPSCEADTDAHQNCKNGMVVDRGVTEVRFWHFYLQAHSCLKGTARPAHYYVILDEIFRKWKIKNPTHKHAADSVEDLTHNMCHLFGRATKAVSICPPAYYADLVCERARLYLSRKFDPLSSDAGGSVTGKSGKAGADRAADEEVMLHDNLKDSMFYI